MVESVNGFLIVRKTLENTETYGSVFRVADKVYCGMERMHLYDAIEDYYEKKLPSDIHRILETENNESNDNLFMYYIKNYTDAVKVLEYVNKKNDLNELITISSDLVSKENGAIEFDSAKIEWLGYDIIRFGVSSLILNGLFFKPGYFSKWVAVINSNGLFPNKDKVQGYVEDYLRCAKDGIVEPYDLTANKFDAVRIGRVL